jgi:hypothetical protein
MASPKILAGLFAVKSIRVLVDWAVLAPTFRVPKGAFAPLYNTVKSFNEVLAYHNIDSFPYTTGDRQPRSCCYPSERRWSNGPREQEGGKSSF